MINVLLSCILLTGCAACGAPPSHPMPVVTDVIKGHVREFLSYTDNYRVQDIVLNNLSDLEGIYIEKIPEPYDEGAVGLCLVAVFFPKRIIYLDPAFIQAYPELTRTLVFHELGHCLLDLEHSEDRVDIMYPTLPTIPDTDWSGAVDRIFKRAE